MSDFHLPPKKLNVDGTERRVGFEFEYTGVSLDRTAALVQSLFGGKVEAHHRFSYSVVDTSVGTFSIESDASLLAQRKWEKYMTVFGLDAKSSLIGETFESILANVSEDFVPNEIVSPPIPFSKLDRMEDLRAKLQAAGALGTHARFYAAYGMQFNPEMPDFKLETMLGYCRAFFLLYDRLLASSDVPLARKVLPFIEPFPQEYVDLIVDPLYRPSSIESFMRDYLEWNPTRNRPLDWLPLFTHLDQSLVFEYDGVERELIKPRPTLHYRLPSSLIDDPRWTISSEWNKWVEIERLAADPEHIARMSEEYLLASPSRMTRLGSSEAKHSHESWIKRSNEFLDEILR